VEVAIGIDTHKGSLVAIGIEGSLTYGASAARTLLGRGEDGREVSPVAYPVECRRRSKGKSDPIDAVAIARAALREPGLPVPMHEPASQEIKLLVDHRELANTHTRMQHRLRWHPHERDPNSSHRPVRGPDR
jgi:transposase